MSTLAPFQLADSIPLATTSRPSRRLPRGVWHVGALLVATATAPLWTLLVAPLVLGVPHVFADFRYLLVRHPAGQPARVALAGLLAPLAALTALRAGALVGGPTLPALEIALGCAAVLWSVAAARAPHARKALVLVALAGLAAAAVRAPAAATLVLAHGHNLVALALWLRWSGDRRERLAVAIAIALAALAIGLGAFDALLPAAGGAAAGLSLDAMRATLAPGLAPQLGARVVLLFCLAQALHYACWLDLIPRALRRDVDRGPWLARLRADLGRPILAVALAATILVVALAPLDPTGVRSGYLSLVLFHGWLELAVIARDVTRGAAG